MAKFTDYTEKTEPVDTDLALIYDTQAKVNKKFTFGNLWKWIAKKIVSEGISQLDTTNKTIPGAINELNSKTYINQDNADSFSFKISGISKTTYVSIIMYGSTSAENVFLYNIFIDTEDNGRKVTFIKIIDGLTSRTFSGSYNDSTNTLSITSNSTIWGGIRLIVIK